MPLMTTTIFLIFNISEIRAEKVLLLIWNETAGTKLKSEAPGVSQGLGFVLDSAVTPR